MDPFSDAMRALRVGMAAHADGIRSLFLHIHRTPETGYRERSAARAIVSRLEGAGFRVECPAAGMPTAFAARRSGPVSGPSLAFLAEYDALPELGHACGHSLSGAASVWAASALAFVVEKEGLGGTISVFGTPAEEAVVPDAGGKLKFLEHGLFAGVDAAMMCHAGPRHVLRVNIIARAVVNLDFFGRSAHAGAAPHKGINALTAALHTLNGLNGLYQQLEPEHRINAIVTDGGKVVNAIPEHAALACQLRAPTGEQLERLLRRVLDCAEAGAGAAGCRFEHSRPSLPVADLRPNEPLLAAYGANLAALGVPFAEEEPETCLSTDAGNVSQAVPFIHPFFGIGEDAELHSRAFAGACESEKAFENMAAAACAMAMTGYDLLTDAGLRERIRASSGRAAGGRPA